MFGKKEFKAADIIFQEGENGDCAYIIESGRVGIFIDKEDAEACVALLGPGEIFGEMAILDGGSRSATARALDECTLTVVSQSQILSRVTDSDPVTQLLIVMLLKRNRRNLKMAGSGDESSSSILNEAFLSTLKIDESSAVDRMKIESELKNALDSNNFKLVYQPIISLEDGTFAGTEALIRWNSQSRGQVSPDLFMGIAEESSLVVAIGRWVIKKACEDYAALVKEFPGVGATFISLNVSGKQIFDPDFFAVLDFCVEENHIDPKNIKLEITERVLVDGSVAQAWIEQCHLRGYKVALDDFGTGYSCLSYLGDLNIDNLKIDRSFVSSMLDKQSALVITEAIVSLAKGLGMTLIAEGIELETELAKVKELGCDFAQGYLLAKPLNYQDLIEYIKNRYSQAA